MRYEDFRDRLQDTLRHAGLAFQHQPRERIDLASGCRDWEVYIPSLAPDPEPFDEELAALAGRWSSATNEWAKGVADLARWIRYSPPPPGTRPTGPRFEDEEDDDEPEKIH
jgi:hypothetical protein